MVAEPAASSTGVAGTPVVAATAPEVQTVDSDDRIARLVALAVEKVVEKLIPQLQGAHQESSRWQTVDDKQKVVFDE
eukprot:12404208-Karenia_brevis.AAC.1